MRATRISLSAIALAVTAVVSMMTAAPGSAAPKLPETYDLADGVRAELANPNGSLPGANDFTCKPSAQHPDPVVLVHGSGGGGQTNWAAAVPVLKNAGYCVFALTYGAVAGAPWPLSQIGGMLPMEESAAQLQVYIDRVLSATGARKVDIVGHSQGTMMPQYYVKFLGGAPKVAKYVSLAPLWAGGWGDFAASTFDFYRRLGVPQTATPIFNSMAQMLHGSDFIKHLWNDGTPYVRGVDYTNISTRYDDMVVPYTVGQIPGPAGYSVRNIVVQDGCAPDQSNHAALAGSRRALSMVLAALDPAHPPTVPCQYQGPYPG